MPDIFDEFLDELKRRQAGQGGSEAGKGAPDGDEPPEEPPPTAIEAATAIDPATTIRRSPRPGGGAPRPLAPA